MGDEGPVWVREHEVEEGRGEDRSTPKQLGVGFRVGLDAFSPGVEGVAQGADGGQGRVWTCGLELVCLGREEKEDL